MEGVIQVIPLMSFITERGEAFQHGDKLIHDLYRQHLRKPQTQEAAWLAVEFQTHR